MNAVSTTRLRRTLLSSTAAALAALMVLAVQPAHADENPTLKVKYDAVGSTHIGALVNSTADLGPAVLDTEMDLVTTDIVDGSLPVPSKVLEFRLLDLVPIRATVTMTQVGPLTGTIKPSGIRGKLLLTSNVAYDIKMSNVQAKVLGIWLPMGIGSNCHTIDPVEIATATPAGEYFTLNGGGRVTGTYTIGGFTGCAPLNFLDLPLPLPELGSIPVNTLVSGPNNTIELTLDNPRFGGE